MGRPPNDADKVDRQERILQAALDLLAEHGIAGVSMRAVAKREVPGHVANRLQAAMGPTKLFHLGADDGLAQFCDHYAAATSSWRLSSPRRTHRRDERRW